jgi:hypothetical protein
MMSKQSTNHVLFNSATSHQGEIAMSKTTAGIQHGRVSIALLIVAAWALFFTGVTAEAAPSLIGLYQFEDASGINGAPIADTSGNLRDGSVTSGNIGLVPSQAGYGNAASFTGAGYVAATLTGAASVVNDYSIAFWMKSNNTAQTNTYIAGRTNANPQHAAIYGYASAGGFAQVEHFSPLAPVPRSRSRILAGTTSSTPAAAPTTTTTSTSTA